MLWLRCNGEGSSAQPPSPEWAGLGGSGDEEFDPPPFPLMTLLLLGVEETARAVIAMDCAACARWSCCACKRACSIL